jgi:hypothetical protein
MKKHRQKEGGNVATGNQIKRNKKRLKINKTKRTVKMGKNSLGGSGP